MKKKKKKSKKSSKLILVFLLVSLICLVILLVISFKLWDLFKIEKIEKIEIIDSCSLFMGDKVHKIRDLPDCQNSCRSRCYVSEKKFQEVEFNSSTEPCNTCICYCK
jgi:hypothetical protein